MPGRWQLRWPRVISGGRCDRDRNLFGGRRLQFRAAARDVQLPIAAVDAAQNQGLGRPREPVTPPTIASVVA